MMILTYYTLREECDQMQYKNFTILGIIYDFFYKIPWSTDLNSQITAKPLSLEKMGLCEDRRSKHLVLSKFIRLTKLYGNNKITG